MRPVGTAEELERRRRRAVELVQHGEPVTQVAHYLGCNRSSIWRWEQKARKGPEGLDAKPHPGREPQLDDSDLREVEKLLVEGPQAHGWSTDLWTAKRVAVVIERYLGVRHHPEHVRRILKERLGWTSQKPERLARERDEREIESWKQGEFRNIKKRCT